MKYLPSERCTRFVFLSTLLYFFSFARLFAADLPPCLHLADTDSIRIHKGASNWVYRNNGSATTLSYNGKIVFTEDDRDIKSISPGGFFKYSKTTFGNCREGLAYDFIKESGEWKSVSSVIIREIFY